ncbi:MAG: HD domain-containing protein [Bacillota bacterium]|nr:HD domain-containing protein [Bacillota bacterium]
MKLAFEQKVARAVVGYSLAIFLFVAICFFAVPGWFPTDVKLNLRNLTLIVATIFLYSMACLYLLIRVIRDRRRMIQNILLSDQDRNKVPVIYDEYQAADRYYRTLTDEVSTVEMEFSAKQRLLSELRERSRGLSEDCDEQNRLVEIEANGLNDFTNAFVSVMNTMDSLVWITDYEGVLQYANRNLLKLIPDAKVHTTTLYDILVADEEDIKLLRRRDFANVKWSLRAADGAFVEHTFSSTRYFEGNTINRLMFVADRNVAVDPSSTYIRINKNLNFINEISELIGREHNTQEYIHRILEKIGLFCQLSAVSIRLKDKTKSDELMYFASYRRRPDDIDESPYSIEASHLGFCFTRGEPVLLNSLTDMLFPDPRVEGILNKGNSLGLFPLKLQKETIGVLALIHDQAIDKDLLLLINSVTINLTIALEKILLIDELKSNYFKTVEAFFTAFEMKVNFLHGHSRRVARVALKMADHLYFDQDDKDNLYISALLHDVGKLSFEEQSLDSYFDSDVHGTLGRRMVEKVGFTRDVLEGVEFHHRDYIEGDRVQPLFAQFVRIANDFDNFFHIAPQQERAIKFLRGLSTQEYSPQLRGVLLDLVEHHFKDLMEIYEEVPDAL